MLLNASMVPFEVMNILVLAFLFAMAMGDSIGIRMANCLGEGHAAKAAFTARLGVTVAQLLSTCNRDDPGIVPRKALHVH